MLKQTLLLAICLLTAPAIASSTVPSLQGTLGASIAKPRRVAASDSGRLFLVDVSGKLYSLTKRGDLVGVVATGVRAVTAGGGKVFAATARAEFLVLNEVTGKVLSRRSLGLGEAPVGMAYDSGRGLVWMAFASGIVQARGLDGALALQPAPSATGALYRLVDIAVDPATGNVWVSQDQKMAGGMVVALDGATGRRVKVIGASGAGPVPLAGALALDGAGQIHVSDLFGGKVAVVTDADAPVYTVGLNEAGKGTLKQPTGIALMENGDLLVVNAWTGRVERYGQGDDLPVCDGDTDCDGMSDAYEDASGLASGDAADSLLDSDGDGLSNVEEAMLGTDARNADTDGDTVADGEEVATGYDPLDSHDHDPIVVAGSMGEFAPGVVSLSASVSNVMEGDTCQASWTQTGGATVTLADAEGFSPSFVARKPGTYQFTVAATCGRFSSEVVSAAATVLNQAPVANAARLAVVELGERLLLSARRASDANADGLTYRWEQVAGRAVLAASAGATVSPYFAYPGSYQFRVTVSDPKGASSTETVSVVALGSRPVPAVAIAGPVVGQVGQPVSLDASASYRHDDAVFSWQQVAGEGVALAGADGPVATFVPGTAGRYAFELSISQNNVTSPVAVVEAFVAAEGLQLPVAVATAPGVASVGSTVSLDGVASTSSSGGVEYRWRQVSGPGAGLGGTTAAVASAYLFEAGAYEFELVVSDAAGVGVPARVRVEARADGRAIPVARVTAPAAALVGERVTLDASASTGARSFRWSQVAGPWVLLEDERIESFRPRAAGTYVFELVVDNGEVSSAPARVSVAVTGDGMED